MILKTCKHCSKQFATDNKSKVFCTVKCRGVYNNDKRQSIKKPEVQEDMFDWAKFKHCIFS